MIQTRDKKSGVILANTVDALLVDDKQLVALNHKTRGYHLNKDKYAPYSLEMDLCNFILKENGYNTSEYAFLFFYYPEKVDEKGDIVFNTKLIETDPARGEKVFKDAIKVLQMETAPEAAEDCEYCKWRDKL